jgi:hypothetical protein
VGVCVAREASKRIVEDLLQSAGVGHGDEDEDDFTEDFLGEEEAGRRRIAEETSPSVVRKAHTFEDESF